VNDEIGCAELSGILRRRGALVLAFFAACWATAGASGLSAVPGAHAAVIALTVVVTLAAVLAAGRAGSRSPRRPLLLPAGWNRSVALVNLGQLAVIGVLVPLLLVAGVPQVVAPAVCLVVGLHFLPLARLFGQPQYRWTGVLLIMVASAGLGCLAAGVGAGIVLSTVGFGAAIVLWVTSLDVALRG
jgi:hypothetical protein